MKGQTQTSSRLSVIPLDITDLSLSATGEYSPPLGTGIGKLNCKENKR